MITAPKFLGYSFNPVSFWYLYTSNMHLQAMILEVNNTFDERRMYFMKNGSGDEVKDAQEHLENPRVAQFTHSWPKDFHVSPFNSRRGSYSLVVHDLFTSPNEPHVNNTITLRSSKEHAKLVARIVSTGDPIDPSKMYFFERVRFVMSWCWVGFVTYPRIVKEAGKLFFRRKLHVWFRPEVVRTSIGRRETSRER